MTFKLGLTGSIGMGKSTTAAMFVEEGCALWDADAAVHRMYAKGGAAVPAVQQAFPDAVQDGEVSRDALKTLLSNDANALERLEQIVHPLVAADRAAFADKSTAHITVFDIPLLYETGADRTMDAVVCVSVPENVQKSRVMSRGKMTPAQFAHITANQLPNAVKCARSDYVVHTDTLEHARAQVQTVVQKIKEQLARA